MWNRTGRRTTALRWSCDLQHNTITGSTLLTAECFLRLRRCELIFIWDFVADTVLGQIVDWFYGQIVGFLGNFFSEMGNMGAELFAMSWVQSVVLFFTYLGWVLFATGLVVAIYKCYNRTQHKENCDGPTTYRAEKVDAVVSKLIRDILQKAGAVSEYDIVHNQIGATASDLRQQIRQAKLELSKKHIEQGRWEGLMLDSLDGKCPFTPEQVKSRLDSVKEAMTSLTASIELLEAQLADSDRLTQELKEQHQQLLSWAEMFDSASIAERKLIVSHLIKAVTLTRGYGIQIDFNISEAQYLNGMEL